MTLLTNMSNQDVPNSEEGRVRKHHSLSPGQKMAASPNQAEGWLDWLAWGLQSANQPFRMTCLSLLTWMAQLAELSMSELPPLPSQPSRQRHTTKQQESSPIPQLD